MSYSFDLVLSMMVTAMIIMLLNNFVPMAVPTIRSSFRDSTLAGETKLV